MEKYIANKIADWCLRHNKVLEIQEVAIRYGIELFLDSSLKIIFLILIGAIFGKGIETVIVIGCFCILRSAAGGIHMHSSLGCFLSMLTMTVISVAGAEIIPSISLYGALALFGVSLIAVYLYAPYTTANNPITDYTIIQSKKKKAIAIIMIMAAVSLIVQNSQIRALILIPVIIEIITILPLWRRKEERTNDECKFTEEDG